MPAIVLPFRRSAGDRAAGDTAGHTARTVPAVPRLSMRASTLTSRDIAHRRAMLSHLTRYYSQRDGPDPVR